jgi:hypothetical protein
LYDLKKIKNIPIALFSGKYDILSCPKDVEWLANELNKDVVVYYKEYELGHDSFIIGKDMSYMNDVIDTINKYSK